MLLTFQTLISPISVFASTETDEQIGTVLDLVSAPQEDAAEEGIQEDSLILDGEKTREVETQEESTTPVEDSPVEEIQEESTKPDGGISVEKDNQEKTVLDAEEEPDSTQVIGTIPVNEVSFKMTINGEDVHNYDKPLTQGQKAEISFLFTTNTEGEGANSKGSSFEFKLPESIIDFKNNFNGNHPGNEEEPAFSYKTTGNVVTVTLEEELGLKASSNTQFKMSFESGFNLEEDSLEQVLVIPSEDGKMTETIKLTFLPTTSNDKMTKKSLGTTSEDGIRFIEWEVWVNTAGKMLSDATLVDTAVGAHEVVAGSVKLTKYEIGLNGVKINTAQVIKEGVNFEDILLKGSDAYKITYKTAVTGEALSGEQTFKNTVNLTNGSSSESATGEQKITFGKALEKVIKEFNNYSSSWEVRYNYNLAKISSESAVITDKISGPHEIDLESIKVYEMTVNENGQASGAGTEVLGGYTKAISQDGKTLTLKFSDGVSKAYRIIYDAKYTDSDNPDFFVENVNLSNSVMAGLTEEEWAKNCQGTTCKVSKSLTQGILKKSYEVDFDKKQINWTIVVKADNPNRAMGGINLTDSFLGEGEHTLIGGENGIKVTGDFVNHNISLIEPNGEGETSKGFVLTADSLLAGKTATIKYSTAFTIEENGSVQPSYKNNANLNWKYNSRDYNLSVESVFTPKPTTVNNGAKEGSFDHQTQIFNWGIKININKQDISGAVLEDTLGPGHKIVEGSLKVYEYTLKMNDDTIGEKSEQPLDPSNYNLQLNGEGSGFTLTFINSLDKDVNNKAYYVEYQTIDSDNILGISKPELEAAHKEVNSANQSQYSNGAKFTTKEKTYTLTTTPVSIKNANNLIEKSAKPDSKNGIYDWSLYVNKSHSTLGDVTVSDEMSPNLMLLPDSIQVCELSISKDGTISIKNNTCKTPDNLKVDSSGEGDKFKIILKDVNRKGYIIQYKTVVLGNIEEKFSNNAIIEFNGEKKENETVDNVEQRFAFSKSDASASSKKGTLKLNKTGLNPANGKVISLVNIEFKLVKVVGGKNYEIATATTNENGDFIFENIRYGTYKLVENTPEGYKPLTETEAKVVLDEETDYNGDENPVLNIVNTENVNYCPAFTLTVKDVDGEPLKAGQKILLKDPNSVRADIERTTNANGEITVDYSKDVIGIYDVYLVTTEISTSIDEVTGEETTTINTIETMIDNTSILYTEGECFDSVQPAPACPNFVITVNDEDGNPYKVKEVILKNNANELVKTDMTDENGQIKLDSSKISAGKYHLYDSTTNNYLGEVDISYKADCQAVSNAPKDCPRYVVVVTDRDGNNRDNVAVEIKNNKGDVVASGTTNTDGQVIITEKYPAPGEYAVYEGNHYIGKVQISYADEKCEAIMEPINACPNFKLTVNNSSNNPREGIDITVKNSNNETIFSGTTDENGQILIPYLIGPGKYSVYEDTNFINTFTVEQLCEAIVKPVPSGGGGYYPPPTDPGEEPGTPENPTDPGEEPGTPENPTIPGEEPGTPENPTEPGEEPGIPGKPSTPGEQETPDGSAPVDDGSNKGDANSSDGKGKYTDAEKLPQTDGESNMFVMLIGIILVTISMKLLAFRRKTA